MFLGDLEMLNIWRIKERVSKEVKKHGYAIVFRNRILRAHHRENRGDLLMALCLRHEAYIVFELFEKRV